MSASVDVSKSTKEKKQQEAKEYSEEKVAEFIETRGKELETASWN